MTNTTKLSFEYEIQSLGIHDSIHGKNNVVYEIRTLFVGKKTITTESGFEEETVSNLILIVHLPVDNVENFIEYKDLTKEHIMKWIEKHVSEKTIENYKMDLTEKLMPTKRYVKPNF